MVDETEVFGLVSANMPSNRAPTWLLLPIFEPCTCWTSFDVRYFHRT